MKRFLFLPAIIILLFSSCCNKQQVEIDRMLLSESDKAWIPYQKGETYLFEYSNGTELNFHVDQREINQAIMGGEDCGEGYITYEKMNVLISSQTPSMFFTLSIDASVPEPLLGISFNSNQTYFILNRDLPPDYTSIDINGHTYQNVYMLEKYENSSNIIEPEIIFYNKTEGIIQIKLTDNETITLKN